MSITISHYLHSSKYVHQITSLVFISFHTVTLDYNNTSSASNLFSIQLSFVEHSQGHAELLTTSFFVFFSFSSFKSLYRRQTATLTLKSMMNVTPHMIHRTLQNQTLIWKRSHLSRLIHNYRHLSRLIHNYRHLSRLFHKNRHLSQLFHKYRHLSRLFDKYRHLSQLFHN